MFLRKLGSFFNELNMACPQHHFVYILLIKIFTISSGENTACSDVVSDSFTWDYTDVMHHELYTIWVVSTNNVGVTQSDKITILPYKLGL